MATSTTRLGLRKPTTLDTFDEATDLNAPMDILDQSVGTQVCTSTTRPTTNLFQGKRIYETDTNNWLFYTGSAWRHQSQPYETTAVPSPHTDQLVYQSSDTWLVKRLAAGSWKEAAATGGTNHEARYYQSTAQSLGDAVVESLALNATDYSSADVTKSGDHKTFTVNRAGLWYLTAEVRINASAGANGERLISLRSPAGSTTLSSSRDTSQTIGVHLNTSCSVRLASGATIDVAVFQQSGAALSTWIWAKSIHISLTWLRP